MLIAIPLCGTFRGCMPPCGLVRRTVLWEMDPSLNHEKGNGPTAQRPRKLPIEFEKGIEASEFRQSAAFPTILGMKFVSTYIYIEIYCASNIDQLRLPNCSRCCHSTLVKGPFLFSYRALSLAILDSSGSLKWCQWWVPALSHMILLGWIFGLQCHHLLSYIVENGFVN